MKFTIGKYIIRKDDRLNWIVQEKSKRYRAEKRKDNPRHFSRGKHATSTLKTEQNWKLVGYYGTLLDAKQELGEYFARDSKNYKEFSKWVNKLKTIK